MREAPEEAAVRLAGSAEVRVATVTAGCRIIAEDDREHDAWKFSASSVSPYAVQESGHRL